MRFPLLSDLLNANGVHKLRESENTICAVHSDVLRPFPDDMTVAIVLPVYDDLPSLCKLVVSLQQIFSAKRLSPHLVVVDDGSLSRIDPATLRSLIDLPLTVLTLRRNVGHQRAIAIGLSHVVSTELARTIIIMDSDGEDDPRATTKLLSELQSAETPNVVVAYRATRSEGKLFAAWYQLYRRVFRALTGHQIGFGNFMVMNIDAARRLTAMAELWISLPASVLRSKLPLAALSTDRGQRYIGNSKMDFVSLILHGFRAIAVFTDRVMARFVLAALGTVFLASLASFIALILKFVGLASPGWLTSVIGISIVVTSLAGGLCLVALLLTLTGGTLFVPAPIDVYRSFIAETSELPQRESGD